jgi:hypothetical protein
MELSTGTERSSASRGRTIAFRVIAAIAGLAAASFSIPFALLAPFDTGPDQIHRIHYIAGGLGFGLLTGVPLLLSAWRPDRWIAAFHLAIASSIAVLVGGLLSGDLVAGGYVYQVVVAVVLIVLHPYRGEVLSVRSPSVPLAVLSILALIPAVAYLLTWSEMQRTAAVGDPHAELHHYSSMAITGIGFALAGIAVAVRGSGWRILAWFVGFSWAAMGVASLAWPDHISAFDTPWAWASIAFGVAFVGVAEWQARSGPPAGAPNVTAR